MYLIALLLWWAAWCFPVLPFDKVKLAFINLVIDVLGISYENLFTQAFSEEKEEQNPNNKSPPNIYLPLTPSPWPRDLKGKNPCLQIYYDTKNF